MELGFSTRPLPRTPHPYPAPAPRTRTPHPHAAPARRTRTPHPHAAPARRTCMPLPQAAPAPRPGVWLWGRAFAPAAAVGAGLGGLVRVGSSKSLAERLVKVPGGAGMVGGFVAFYT
jgi:hypothetical protein